MADRQVGPGLYVKLGLDYNGIIGGIGGVSLALNQTLDLFGKFEGMAQGFINLANNAGRMGKEIKDNARDLGLSTSQYQQWTHAAIAAGSSAEEITGSIRMMSVRMKEASDPTSAMGKQLAALGVSVIDSNGNMRSMNDVLLDIFPALNALPEGFARNQASMGIFGRNFSNIADLAGLSREEIQSLIDQAPIFSDAKIAQLDAYNTQMQLLNERMERSTALAGSEMISSFSTWGDMIDTSLQKGQPLFLFFKDLNLMLEMVAEGVTLLGARYIAFSELVQIGGAKFGNLEEFNKTVAEADRNVSEMRRKFALAESGWFEGARWDEATQSWKKAESATKSYAAGAADATKAVTELGDASQKAAKSSAAAWDPSVVVGSAGSEMQLFMQREMELGTSYQDALNNWAAGAPTPGAVAGTLGAVTWGKSSTKTTGAGSELTKAKTQYTEIEKAYDTHISQMLEYYIQAEQQSLTHWTAESEMVRVAMQNMSEAWKQYFLFAAQNPTIHNVGIVTWTKEGPDWTPESNPVFMQAARIASINSQKLAYSSADFSGVQMSGKSEGSQKVKVDVTIKDQTTGGIKANVSATSEAWAGADYAGGRK